MQRSSMLLSLSSTILVISLASLVNAVSDVPYDSSLEELYKLATGLESVGASTQRQQGIVLPDMYTFLRPLTAEHAEFRSKFLDSKAEEFLHKALQINPRKDGKIGVIASLSNWGTYVHLDTIAGNEPTLRALVKKLRDNNKQHNVTCDVSLYKHEQTQHIVYVLQTAVKFIVLGNTSQVQRAIYDGSKALNFNSKFNFVQDSLTNEQVSALASFYATRSAGTDRSTVGQAIDHVRPLNQLVVSRLLETCTQLQKFDAKLNKELQTDVENKCKEYNLSEATVSNYQSVRRTDVHELCSTLLKV